MQFWKPHGAQLCFAQLHSAKNTEDCHQPISALSSLDPLGILTEVAKLGIEFLAVVKYRCERCPSPLTAVDLHSNTGELNTSQL